MRVIGESSEAEMVAWFLRGELASERFGDAVREALASAGRSERLLTAPDLSDAAANEARADLLGVTRGYRRNRDVFDETFPRSVRWTRAELAPHDLAQVRYIEYSYWNELSGGTRLPTQAADRIRAGIRVFDVPNDRFFAAAAALERGEHFPPLILAGPRLDALVCLEGNLRLTAYALTGFPTTAECIVGVAASLRRWCH